MTGEELYGAYRSVENQIGGKRGNTPEPTWKNLKPWRKRVWTVFAKELDRDEV